MSKNNILLYGANGYTAQLILDYLPAYQLPVILAGRNAEEITKLGKQHSLPYRIFDLNDQPALHEALKDICLVIHCAGPFAATAKQMVHACIGTGTHYIDINGDIAVFEWIKTQDEKARAANVMLLPGAGFDVIPTDCIAARLKLQVPDATHLKLAFANFGGAISHGTALTMIGKLGSGGAKRKDGQIVSAAIGKETFPFTFQNKKLLFMSIPWGDISTAHFTTGIPNISTYTSVPPKLAKWMKFQFAFNWLLRMEWVKNILRKKIKSRAAGPDSQQREKAFSFIWGEATNAYGDKTETSQICLDGYTLTAYGCLLIGSMILKGHIKPGYQTPVTAFGANIIDWLPQPKNSIIV